MAGVNTMLNIFSSEERARQEKSEEIASTLRELTVEFMIAAAKRDIDVNSLKINWNYDDGIHVINGGI